jgi:hypothetical protein
MLRAGRARLAETHLEPKGSDIMIRIQLVRWLTAALAGSACLLLASAAFAVPSFARVPASGLPAVAPPGPVTSTVAVAGGMPGWQIALIAVGAALLAAGAAVFLDRARAARRTMTRTAA